MFLFLMISAIFSEISTASLRPMFSGMAVSPVRKPVRPAFTGNICRIISFIFSFTHEWFISSMFNQYIKNSEKINGSLKSIRLLKSCHFRLRLHYKEKILLEMSCGTTMKTVSGPNVITGCGAE